MLVLSALISLWLVADDAQVVVVQQTIQTIPDAPSRHPLFLAGTGSPRRGHLFNPHRPHRCHPNHRNRPKGCLSPYLTFLLETMGLSRVSSHPPSSLYKAMMQSRPGALKDLNGAVAPTSTQIYGSLENGDKIKTSSEKEKEKNSNATDEGG
ncbi:hypothetical protein D9758_013981 [Tetrapyrgos nigripes]|uniref:Uncharacterized protein n=1 Tax=Tetrapyrgos nigripes TaxID=182062 RepID=A0A8H5G7R1_9AGAR|nr:hypothetical protein D9758_013981 [Tetrapyrgos nigripes]